MGVAYGHSYGGTWGISQSADWHASVNREQAKHSGNIRLIMEKVAWSKLVPDWDNAAVTGGRGTYGGSDYASAARADDGSAIVVFTPSSRALNVDLSKLSGAGTAQWYDPTTAQPAGAAQAVSNSGTQAFNTPGNNAGGDADWVLVIKKN
jgi:hypothetical protein